MKNIDHFFMDIAYKVSIQSTCISKKVGAIITKDNRIISIGYNGVPSGIKHCNEVFSEKTKEHSIFTRVKEVHAEMNAVLYALKNGISLENTVLYCTLSPCNNCCKLIYTSGIKKIVYSETHDTVEELLGLTFLKEECNILVNQI